MSFAPSAPVRAITDRGKSCDEEPSSRGERHADLSGGQACQTRCAQRSAGHRRLWGPDLNRDTIGNLARAGFSIVREVNVYLDLVKAIEATRG
jgi:hypothetical protein